MSRLRQRLEHLAELEDGWYGEGTKAPTEASLAAAFKYLYWLPYGAVFPTKDGGIQAEWSTKRWGLEMEFDYRGKMSFLAVQV
jgi:hypothetical protein